MREWTADLTGAKVEAHVIEGGQHFLSASNPKEVDPLVVAFLHGAVAKS